MYNLQINAYNRQDNSEVVPVCQMYRVEGPLDRCALPDSASKLGKGHLSAVVDAGYTNGQRLAHLSNDQKVPCSHPVDAA